MYSSFIREHRRPTRFWRSRHLTVVPPRGGGVTLGLLTHLFVLPSPKPTPTTILIAPKTDSIWASSYITMFLELGERYRTLWCDFLVDEVDGAKTATLRVEKVLDDSREHLGRDSEAPNVLYLNLGCKIYKGSEMTESEHRSLMSRWWTFTKFICTSCARF